MFIPGENRQVLGTAADCRHSLLPVSLVESRCSFPARPPRACSARTRDAAAALRFKNSSSTQGFSQSSIDSLRLRSRPAVSVAISPYITASFAVALFAVVVVFKAAAPHMG